MSTDLGLGSSPFPDVSADSLHDALAHLDGGLGGLIPSPHLLGVVGNLGNLDNLLQEDGGLLQHKLEVVFEAVGDLPAAQVGQQQHVNLLDSCLAVPEQGLVLQSAGQSCQDILLKIRPGISTQDCSIAIPEQGPLLQSKGGLLKISVQGLERGPVQSRGLLCRQQRMVSWYCDKGYGTALLHKKILLHSTDNIFKAVGQGMR